MEDFLLLNLRVRIKRNDGYLDRFFGGGVGGSVKIVDVSACIEASSVNECTRGIDGKNVRI